MTARALLDALGHAQVDAGARSRCPAVCALGDEHGWDTPLHRADHLLGRGVLRAEPVALRDALAAALAARDGLNCIYWNDRDAIGAFEGPTRASPARPCGAPGARCTSNWWHWKSWPMTTEA